MMLLWWYFPYIAMQAWLDQFKDVLDMVNHPKLPDSSNVLEFRRRG